MASALPDDIHSEVMGACETCYYEYTGSGYYLTVRHPALPAESRTLSAPVVIAESDDITAGFLIHLGDHALTLECHTWGPVDVPADFRDRDVCVRIPDGR